MNAAAAWADVHPENINAAENGILHAHDSTHLTFWGLEFVWREGGGGDGC